jgi:hypothetical protein
MGEIEGAGQSANAASGLNRGYYASVSYLVRHAIKHGFSKEDSMTNDSLKFS